MALKMAVDSEAFFSHLKAPGITQAVVELAKAGVSVEFSIYSVMFMKDGKLLSAANLSTSVPSILKGVASPHALMLSRSNIVQSIGMVASHLYEQDNGFDKSYILKMLVGKDAEDQISVGPGGVLKFTLTPENKVKFVPADEVEVVAYQGLKPSFITVDSVADSDSGSADNSVDNGVIPLSKATKVLQQVRGTDTGSVYIAVGVGVLANLAIRYKGAGVSLRIEARSKSADAAVSKVLAKTGFSKKDAGHWSMHFEVPNEILQARVLGSVLSGLISSGLAMEHVELDRSKVVEAQNGH